MTHANWLQSIAHACRAYTYLSERLQAWQLWSSWLTANKSDVCRLVENDCATLWDYRHWQGLKVSRPWAQLETILLLHVAWWEELRGNAQLSHQRHSEGPFAALLSILSGSGVSRTGSQNLCSDTRPMAHSCWTFRTPTHNHPANAHSRSLVQHPSIGQSNLERQHPDCFPQISSKSQAQQLQQANTRATNIFYICAWQWIDQLQLPWNVFTTHEWMITTHEWMIIHERMHQNTEEKAVQINWSVC